MINEQGFIVAKNSRVINKLTNTIRLALRPISFMSDEELQGLPAGDVLIFDVETYFNFWYVAFKSLTNGKFIAFERSPDCNFDPMKLRWVLWRFCIVGFNSRNYDLPMIELACKGATCEQLKEASDYIIQSGPSYGTEKVTPFSFERKYGVKIGRYNHIDLIEVAPLQGSLKLYAGRLHAERMQDLPFPENHILTQEDAEVVRPYCCNDLANTELLFNELAPELKLRAEMSEEYGVDLRSKSDAQIAEAVINSELLMILGYYPKKPTLAANTILSYTVPDFICYQTEQLREMLEVVKNARFHLDGMGSPIMPPELEKLKVTLGSSTYKLGMGGVHSTEKKTAHYATDDIILADNDVARFYPSIILNLELFPPHLGEAFLKVYKLIIDKRDNAKAQAALCKDKIKKLAKDESTIEERRRLNEEFKKWKSIDATIKIVINGSFGKLGSKFSTLYAPQLMLQVTITGQLSLLMLIEAVELAGIEVISGNTDGFVSKYPKARHQEVRDIIAAWEAHTNFVTEETLYKAVYSRDVNNYVAIKESGDPDARFLDDRLGVKTKGTYCERGSALNSILSKNPETLVCSDAVIKFLAENVPVEKTIKECRDFRRFVSVKNVRGGGEKNGQYLGKVVRWYYPKNEAGYIAYVGSGNKVAKTDGARPVMDLPEEFPTDIDYEWYIEEATSMLYDCGRFKKAKTASLSFF